MTHTKMDDHHDTPRPIFKAMYFAVKCVMCIAMCSTLQQELFDQPDGVQQLQQQQRHHSPLMQAQLPQPSSVPAGLVPATLLALNGATMVMAAALLVFTVSKPRWYRKYWQSSESAYHLVALQLVSMLHCIHRPLIADVPITTAILATVLPISGHHLGSTLVHNLITLPLWLATDFYVRLQASHVAGTPAMTCSAGGRTCAAAGGTAGVMPPSFLGLASSTLLRLALIFACQCLSAAAVQYGLTTREQQHEVEEKAAAEAEESASLLWGPLAALVLWLKSPRARQLAGPLVYMICSLYILYVLVPVLPTISKYGPMSVEPGAAYSPAQVYGVFVAAWIISRADFRADWWQLSELMALRLREQRRKHSQQLELTAVEKRRAEEAVLELQHEKEELSHLRDEHQRLLQQQQVLQAELQVALDKYVPSTFIDAGTPADRMLGMLAEMLEGGTPSLDSILFVQSTLLSARNVYQPVDLQRQMQSCQLDDDISRMLVQQLTDKNAGEFSALWEGEEGGGGGEGDDYEGGEVSGSSSDPTNCVAALPGEDLDDVSADVEVDVTDDGNSSDTPLSSPEWGDSGRDRGDQTGQMKPASGFAPAIGDDRLGGDDDVMMVKPRLRQLQVRPRRRQQQRRQEQQQQQEKQQQEKEKQHEVVDFGYDDSGLAAALRDICGSTSLAQMYGGSLTAGGSSDDFVRITRPRAPLSSSTSSSTVVTAGAQLHRAAVRRGSLFVNTMPSSPMSDYGSADDGGGGGGNSTNRLLSLSTRGSSMRRSSLFVGSMPSSPGAYGAGDSWGSRDDAVRALTRLRAPIPPPVPPPIYEDVERLLATSDTWQFDAFELCSATHDHPLSTLAYYVMHSSGVMAHYKLSGKLVARFFRQIEAGYADHPYHSRTHACNVLQVMHVLMHHGGLVPKYCDPLTILACYIAAACHDFEHAGVTNDFLVASTATLALRYNDRSPQENHHVAAAFTVLRDPDNNFLARLPKPDFDRLRKMVIDLVLATDMKQHFAITSQFNTVHRLSLKTSEQCSPCTSSRQSATGDSGGGPSGVPLVGIEAAFNRRQSESQIKLNAPRQSFISMRSSTQESSPGLVTELRRVSREISREMSADIGRVSRECSSRIVAPVVQPLDDTERLLSLQMALKCADLGHMAAADLSVHVKWVQSLEEEMFRQGDQEKALSLPVSPLFDRDKPGVTKSQIGFYEIVVIPLFKSYSQVFAPSKPLLMQAMRDYQHWSSLAVPAPPSAAPSLSPAITPTTSSANLGKPPLHPH